jgi:hypothetical protein
MPKIPNPPNLISLPDGSTIPVATPDGKPASAAPGLIITAAEQQVRAIVETVLAELGITGGGGNPNPNPVTLPTLTITPATGVAADAAAGTLLGTVNVATPSGATRALILGGPAAIMDPDDTTGRRIIRSDTGTLTAGTLSLSVRDTHGNATNSPQNGAATVTIAAAGGGTPTITKPTFSPASATFPLDAAATLKLADILPTSPAAGITRTTSGTLTANAGKSQVLRGGTAAAGGQSLTLTVRDALTSNPAVFEESTFTATAEVVVVPEPVGAFNPALYVAQTPPAMPESGVVFAPLLARSNAAGAIQSFRFAGPKGAPVPALPTTFGMSFPAGKIFPAQNKAYAYDLGDGVLVPVQIDVKRLHADGSAKNGSVSCMAPLVQADTPKAATIKENGTASGTNVDLMAAAVAMFGASITVVSSKSFGAYPDGNYQDNGTVTAINQTTDISPAALRGSITPVYWRRGPICTEARFEKRLTQGLRVLLNLRAYSNGTIVADYGICSDLNMWSNPGNVGSWLVNVSLTHNGTSVLSLTNFRMVTGQKFRKVMRSDLSPTANAGAFPPVHYPQFDTGLWMQNGFLPNYDLATGLAETTLAQYASVAASYRTPLGTAGLPKDMPGTGDRDELGIMPAIAEAWCVTQDPRAHDVMIAQAEASGHIPWNFHDAAKGVSLNNFPTIGYPNMWLDYRGDQNPANLTLIEWGPTGWKIDMAHQPATTLPAYLATGDQWFADLLEQFACFNVYDQATYARYRQGDKDWLICQGNQVRETGWRLNAVAQAVAALPGTSPLLEPLRQLLDYNFQYLIARQPAWQTGQGAAYGWHAGVDADPASEIKPWMDDHATAGKAMAYILAGIESAGTHLQWASNWSVGRMLQPDNVFDYRRGSYYNAIVGDAITPNSGAKTWAAMSGVLHPPQEGLNAAGFANGNYPVLALRSVALHDIIGTTDQGAEIIARHKAEGVGPVGYSLEERRAKAKDFIVPLERASGQPGEGETVAPGIVAGQSFSNPANAALNTVLGRIGMTGDAPTTVTSSDPRFAVELDGDVLLKQTISDTTVDRTFTSNITASNAGGSSTQPVTFNFTAVPADPGGGDGGTGPGYPTLPVTYHTRLAMRRTKQDYAGSIVTLETTVAPIVSQAFGLNSSGVVDRAAVTAWLSTRAANARGTYATWHNQDASGSPFAAPSAGFRPRFTKDDGSFYYMSGGPQDVPCVRIQGGTQGLKALLSGMPAGGKKLGAVIAFQQVGANAQFHRVLAFTGTGQANDYDNPASIALIDQNDGGEYQTETNSENINLFTGGAGVKVAVAVVVDATLNARAVRHKVNDDVIMGTEGGFAPGMALPSSGTLRVGYFDDAGSVAGPELLVSEVALFTFDALTDLQIETLQGAVYAHAIVP